MRLPVVHVLFLRSLGCSFLHSLAVLHVLRTSRGVCLFTSAGCSELADVDP